MPFAVRWFLGVLLSPALTPPVIWQTCCGKSAPKMAELSELSEEAQRIEATAERLIAANRAPRKRGRKPKTTCGSYAQSWLERHPRPKQSTNDCYANAVYGFRVEFAGRDLAEIDVPTALEWAQRNRWRLTAVRAMFSDARREGLISANPFMELRLPGSPGRKRIEIITEAELDRILALCEQVWPGEFGQRFRAAIEFAALVCLRPSEMFGLDRSDIEPETVHIRRQFHCGRITSPKNGEERDVYLPPRAAAAIERLPRGLRCPLTGGEILFVGRMGKRIRQSSLNTYWKPVRAAFRAELSPDRAAALGNGALDFYALRHVGATYLVERGVESWIVARQLGHKDGGRLVERTYGHPRDELARERLRAAYAELDQIRPQTPLGKASNGRPSV
jgi:integrase